MKELSPKWVGVMVGSAVVAAGAIVLLVAGVLGIFPRAHAQDADTFTLGEGESPFVAVADEVLPAVVNISSSQKVKVVSPFDYFDDPFFRRFFGDQLPETPREQTRYGLGSGFIFRSDGYILTNNHVIAGAQDITVSLHDGRTFDGKKVKVVGTDPQTDLAVIKIDADNLPVARLGNSDSLRVGDWAIAIGNSFGLEGTVTVGVISAKGRTNLPLPNQPRYQNYLQTDAAINPGNSGGPLCNITGEVIGINTAITSSTGSSSGVGFAVPINMAKNISQQLIEKGKVERGYLGVYPQELTEDLRTNFGIKDKTGVLIADVSDGTPASKAGLKEGDVIVTFASKKIENVEQFRELVAATAPGTTVQMEIIRDGDRKTLSAKLDLFPEDELAKGTTPGEDETAPFGIKVRSLTSSERQVTGLTSGVVIDEISSGSTAERAGLTPGDVILELDKQVVSDPASFLSIARAAKAGKKESVLVRFWRQGRRSYTTLRIE